MYARLVTPLKYLGKNRSHTGYCLWLISKDIPPWLSDDDNKWPSYSLSMTNDLPAPSRLLFTLPKYVLWYFDKIELWHFQIRMHISYVFTSFCGSNFKKFISASVNKHGLDQQDSNNNNLKDRTWVMTKVSSWTNNITCMRSNSFHFLWLYWTGEDYCRFADNTKIRTSPRY